MEIESWRLGEGGALVTSAMEVVEHLEHAKDTGKLLGVVSSTMGHGIFLCGVREIRQDVDECDLLIVLEGCLMPHRDREFVVYLTEIAGVFPFVQNNR